MHRSKTTGPQQSRSVYPTFSATSHAARNGLAERYRNPSKPSVTEQSTKQEEQQDKKEGQTSKTTLQYWTTTVGSINKQATGRAPETIKMSLHLADKFPRLKPDPNTDHNPMLANSHPGMGLRALSPNTSNILSCTSTHLNAASKTAKSTAWESKRSISSTTMEQAHKSSSDSANLAEENAFAKQIGGGSPLKKTGIVFSSEECIEVEVARQVKADMNQGSLVRAENLDGCSCLYGAIGIACNSSDKEIRARVVKLLLTTRASCKSSFAKQLRRVATSMLDDAQVSVGQGVKVLDALAKLVRDPKQMGDFGIMFAVAEACSVEICCYILCGGAWKYTQNFAPLRAYSKGCAKLHIVYESRQLESGREACRYSRNSRKATPVSRIT